MRTTKEDLVNTNVELGKSNVELREGYHKIEAKLEIAHSLITEALKTVRQAQGNGQADA